jgi:hypothetical protein
MVHGRYYYHHEVKAALANWKIAPREFAKKPLVIFVLHVRHLTATAKSHLGLVGKLNDSMMQRGAIRQPKLTKDAATLLMCLRPGASSVIRLRAGRRDLRFPEADGTIPNP